MYVKYQEIKYNETKKRKQIFKFIHYCTIRTLKYYFYLSMSKWFSHFDDKQVLFLNDLILGPLVFLFIILYVKNKLKQKKDFVYQQYFLKALVLRLVCSVILALVYQYYYKGGDTMVYYTYAMRLREVMYENFSAFFDLAFNPNFSVFNSDYFFGTGSGYYLNDSSRFIIRMTLYLSFFLINSYILISFAFSLFCFYGCWKLFKLFYELYPHLHKELALSCLFLPSVCFWGSGLMKDPISLGALGLLTYHLYYIVFKNTRIFGRTVIILTCIFMIYEIKVYILLSYFPPLMLWMFLRARKTINNSIFRTIVTPLLVSLGIIISLLVFSYIAKNAEKYSTDSIVRTAKDTQNWLVYSSQKQGGSFYTLGIIDYSFKGIVKVFPKAVNVALFRPYIWEAKKPILIPAAIEGLISLFFTIRLLYKAGFIRIFKLIIQNPEVQFCLIFSVMFAFSVGFTSFNFGALVRYKIPSLPFYYMALFILADKEKVAVLKKVPVRKKTPAVLKVQPA